MSSRLEIAVARQRTAVLRQESAAVKRILRAYDGSRVELIKRIDAFAQVLQERDLTASEAIRFDRAQELFAQVEEEVARLAGLTHKTVIDTQTQMVAQASTNALQLVQASAPSSYSASLASSWNRLNPGAVEAFVGRMGDGSPLEATLRQFGDAVRPDLADIITKAIVTGQGPRAAAAEMAQYVDGASYKLLRISRTEILSSYRTATKVSASQNADILDSAVWVCSLSSNTCPACLAMSGEHFPVDYDMETHPQCRCTLVYSVKGVGLPDMQTGDEWLAGQSSATQRDVLGSKGYDLYASGDATLRDFAQRDVDPNWGGTIRRASIAEVNANASRRAA